MSELRVPTVEMLWEPDDPGRALGERFGFADHAAAARWVAAMLDEHWGVRVDSCDRIVMSGGNALAWVGTPAGRRLAKWSVVPDRFPRLAATAHLTHWLDGRGLPVSAPVPARDGRLQVETDRVSMGLQREIAGDLLDTGDLKQVYVAGATLARLQQALSAHPEGDQFAAYGVPERPLTDRITGWLDTSAGHLPSAARDTLRQLVADAPPDRLARQLVHFDFRSANVLWASNQVAAIIDFEEAQLEHPLVELARATIVLGTRYHNWGPVPPEVHAEFRAGYCSERPLTPEETAWADLLVLWQALAWVPPGDDPTGWRRSAMSRLPRP